MEGIRLTYSVSSRSPRAATEEDLVYRGTWIPPNTTKFVRVNHVIPRGYAIGMSSSIMHHNEEIFPDSSEFIPGRWMTEDGNRKSDLDKHIMSFSKGSRQCIGIKLVFFLPSQRRGYLYLEVKNKALLIRLLIHYSA
jgi:hypothetical protein